MILTAAPHPVTEGDDVTVTATLTAALASSVTLDLELAAGTAEAGDYGSADSITIAAGATTGTATISTEEDTDKDDETFTVKLVDLPDSVAAGNPTSLTVTIADDDKPPPPVSLAATPTVVREGSPITVTVALPVALPGDVKVPLSYTDGSGTSAPADYSAPPSVTIAAGKTSATGTITTMTNSDTASDEFTVSLDASHADWPDTVSAGSASSVKLSIVDSSVSKPEVGVYARGKNQYRGRRDRGAGRARQCRARFRHAGPGADLRPRRLRAAGTRGRSAGDVAQGRPGPEPRHPHDRR